MKHSTIRLLLLISMSAAVALPTNQKSYAEDINKSNGHITFTGEYEGVGVRDPEKPDQTVDPGETPSTSGKLRIDFVPQLNFTSANKVSDKDTVYSVNAQLFHGETAARGNFVQVSDYRGEAMGWTLQLRQETQFQNAQTANSQLDGAYLSFDKSWVNSTMDKATAPNVSKEVIRLDNIGATYNLAEAKSGNGSGTWSISFGASSENPAEMSNTLSPKKDQKDQPMLDTKFDNKQMHENSALTLSVPGATKKDPVTYSTVLTWILAELP